MAIAGSITPITGIPTSPRPGRIVEAALQAITAWVTPCPTIACSTRRTRAVNSAAGSRP